MTGIIHSFDTDKEEIENRDNLGSQITMNNIEATTATVVSSDPLSSHESQDQEREESNAGDSLIVLEVCQGQDCFGLGGGAAILELEDLASSLGDNSSSSSGVNHGSCIHVVPGGCRKVCTMGPSVHYYSTNNSDVRSSTKKLVHASEIQLQQKHHQSHFTKVRSVQDCRSILQHVLVNQNQQQGPASNCHDAVVAATTATCTTSSGMNNSIMVQRAEKKRWYFLRQMARAKAEQERKKSDVPPKRSCIAEKRLSEELEDAIVAEVCASRGNPQALELAHLRRRRWEARLHEIFYVCRR